MSLRLLAIDSGCYNFFRNSSVGSVEVVEIQAFVCCRLSDSSIDIIRYNWQKNYLFIAYSNGNIDATAENGIKLIAMAIKIVYNILLVIL